MKEMKQRDGKQQVFSTIRKQKQRRREGTDEMDENDSRQVCFTIGYPKQQRSNPKQVSSTTEKRRISIRIRSRLQACSTIRDCSSEPLLNPKRKTPIHQMEIASSCSENTLKKQKTTHAVQKILMDDIIIDILRRLPPKSLGRFKCSSKKWYNFISHDVYFRDHYLQNFGRSTFFMGLFCHSQGKVCFLPTPGNEKILTQNALDYDNELLGIFSDDKSVGFVDDNTSLQFVVDGCGKLFIVAQSNGFLLCSTEFYPLNYFIFNPITKEKFYLPYPTMTSNYAVTGFICQGNLHGPLDYKVVRAVSPREPCEDTYSLMIEVLSSSYDQKELKLTCSTLFQLNHKNDVPAIISEDGVMYWSVLTGYTYRFAVLIYDPRKNNSLQLEMIVLPGEAGVGYRKRGAMVDVRTARFGRVNGLIVYALCYVQNNDHHLEMWVLDEPKKEWSLRYRVNNLGIPPEKLPFGLGGVHPLDHDILLVHINGKMRAWYNVKSKRVVVVFALNKEPVHPHFIHPYVYPAAALLFSTGHQLPSLEHKLDVV